MYALDGVRVLEFSNYLAGPFCGAQLADLGADVVKVESPRGGDMERPTGPQLNGEGSGFVRLNRNKRGLALDLKKSEGRGIARRLIEGADVVVENLRPGAMDKLGLGYADCRGIREDIIYVSISGWGKSGPLANLPGVDIMAQARSGLMSVTGPEGGENCKVGVPVCDLVTGVYAALAATSALYHRRCTGAGQLIETTLYETGVSLALWEAARYFATGEIPTAQGSAHPMSAPYQAVRAADGSVTLAAVTPQTWQAVCDIFDMPDLVGDPAYGDKNLRRQRREELVARIEKTSMTRPVSHWMRLLTEAEVPCAPVQTYDQVFNDPHLHEREFFWDAEHYRAGTVRMLGSPMSFSQTPTRREMAGPSLGEHSREILSALDLDDEDVERLVSSGVVGARAGD